MTNPYAITYQKAAYYGLVPGKAERILYDSCRFKAKEFRHVTAGILLSRYSAALGIGLSLISTVNFKQKKTHFPWIQEMRKKKEISEKINA